MRCTSKAKRSLRCRGIGPNKSFEPGAPCPQTLGLLYPGTVSMAQNAMRVEEPLKDGVSTQPEV
jgi:hypothetical protein